MSTYVEASMHTSPATDLPLRRRFRYRSRTRYRSRHWRARIETAIIVAALLAWILIAAHNHHLLLTTL